ncbi:MULTISPECIES: ABC transporter permease [unclassified Janthinobacterium]|uniref:ABC transporter permease n=1 Tax=unclassified Janthinobacterium TaxID=2610881 RepID=UPI00087E307B|nr:MULTISPECIES: FtsX-like permease family protein [unclassified Janthinobacterium]SDA85765.1 putative ABC transport system permease protein [Janthinobacterium sp. 551a]SFB65821.1 putative ABC transport system permease protein [Janthinobacterium sp. 344]
MEIRPILSALMRSKTGAILVAVQVALSLAILANALHIVNVRQEVAARPSGVAAESEVFHLLARNLRPLGHNEELALQKRLAAAARAVPGVVSVAQVSQVPLSRSGSNSGFAASRKQENSSAIAAVYLTPDSLIKTWGLQLREGRDFTPAEIAEIDQNVTQVSPPQVIITRAMAEKIHPGGGSALGMPLFLGTGEDAQQLQVVGVIDRLQTQGAEVGEQGEYSVIFPVRLTGDGDTLLTIRTEAGQRDRVMKEAEQAIRAATPDKLIVRIRSLNEDRDTRYRADRALSWMLITVSALLLLVTASGIVGIASLWVTQRRKQIGVRRALGARKVDILRYFLTENFMITSVGVAAGVVLALALNHLLVSQLEMARLPLYYLLGGALVFWLLGLVAVYGPAWRAASISPATATRST